jgi:hypothetical protein
MLSKDLLNKKKHIDKVLNNANNEFDIVNLLRTECDRISSTDKEIILNFERADFKISKKNKRVEKIVTYDKTLNELKEFTF